MIPSAEDQDSDLGPPVIEPPKTFKCGQCGAQLQFEPGLHSLKCSYCGHENVIPQGEEDIRELDFHAYLQEAGSHQELQERLTLKCQSCGAESTADANITAQQCPFCDASIISTAMSTKVIKPRSLLPFKIKDHEARQSYGLWIKGLWFAPGELRKRAATDFGIAGIYIPFWTYDAETLCFYTGQRGTYYYVTETRTVRNSQGKSVQQRVQVRKIRWSFTMGRVWNSFNDVLIPSTHSLPDKLARDLEPWDLDNLVPYKDEYLSGFKAESYQVGLEEGFEAAKAVMDAAIRTAICRDIGGDEQRILTAKTQHDKVTFKHVLLPVWLSAYRYKNKVYRFMVNARTGEVQGERPWSWPKIAAAATAAAVAGGVILNLLKDIQ